MNPLSTTSSCSGSGGNSKRKRKRQDLAAVGSGGNESSFLIASDFEPSESEDRSKDRKVVVGAMASIPCGVCPRIRVCTPNGIVNPTNCLHYQNWLDF